MAEFVNPYNFVRIEYNPNKSRPPLSHDRVHVENYSGRLNCALTTISRVTTKSFDYEAGRRIYGSSLKGMIRSVAEAIAQACLPLGGRKCNLADSLCICCCVFGWLDKGNVHMGRVHIGDGLSQDTNRPDKAYIGWQALSSPKPRHNPFYKIGHDEDRGRKFYYHHNPNRAEQKISNTRQRSQDERVSVARANRTFLFAVDFADLTGPELGLLLYALQLEDDWYHKFGKAKPLGFGTVKITITEITLLPSHRYEAWDARPTPLETMPLAALGVRQELVSTEPDDDADTIWNRLSTEQRRTRFIETRVHEFFQQHLGVPFGQRTSLSHWRELRHLLTRHDDYNIHYPSQNWFQKNSRVELPTAEEIEGTPPGDRSKWLKE